MLCYTPGSGTGGPIYDYALSQAASQKLTPGTFPNSGIQGVYPMSANPYGSPYSYIGDKVIGFEGNGTLSGYSTLLGYQNSSNGLSYLFTLNANTDSYSLVYSNP